MIYRLLLLNDCVNGVILGSWALLHISVLHVVSAVIVNSAVSQRQVYKIKNTILPSVDSVKDLGVMVDHHRKFDIHISLAVRKAMLRFRLILKCFPPVTKIYCSKRTLLTSDLSLNTVVLFGHRTLKIWYIRVRSEVLYQKTTWFMESSISKASPTPKLALTRVSPYLMRSHTVLSTRISVSLLDFPNHGTGLQTGCPSWPQPAETDSFTFLYPL